MGTMRCPIKSDEKVFGTFGKVFTRMGARLVKTNKTIKRAGGCNKIAILGFTNVMTKFINPLFLV